VGAEEQGVTLGLRTHIVARHDATRHDPGMPRHEATQNMGN